MINKLVCVLLSMTLLTVNAWAGPEVERPDVRVGSIWVYRTLDGFTSEVTREFSNRVVDVNEREIVVQSKKKNEQKGGLMYFSREWNAIDTASQKYEPYFPDLKFPMKVGAAWKMDYRLTNKTGRSSSGFSNARVVGMEKVNVLAGTFDAYRIENDIESRVSDADAAISKLHIVVWYSPTVQRHVRREVTTSQNGRVRSKTIDELVEYSLQNKARNAEARPSAAKLP